VGDVHGCDDLLAEVHEETERDLKRQPPTDYRIIHVGDYVDRGPASAAVLDRLVALRATDPRVICLRGNHEDLLLGFLASPQQYGDVWLGNGGDATLASYELDRDAIASLDPAALASEFARRLPAAHADFLRDLVLVTRFGDYVFVHAGIRPTVPLDRQDPHDLTWIRDEFLTSRRDYGVVVVHGHTPAREPEVRPNRINIDTGAVFTGRLTCLVLQDAAYRFL